ncbi:MAG: hypothetical protein PUE21_04085 [Lachnospiraceae bacterium]|nr:hypothetical protein [Lachnospiraceae bacterium]
MEKNMNENTGEKTEVITDVKTDVKADVQTDVKTDVQTEVKKPIRKKNNALFAVGGLSVINILTCIIFGIIFLIATFQYFTHVQGLSISIAYYITHIVSLLLFGLSWLFMIIGGFSRKHGFCLAGTIVLGGNFLISRLTNFFIDLSIITDTVRLQTGIMQQVEALGHMVLKSKMIQRETDLIPAIFISLFFVAAIIILIVRCTPARGKALKIVGLIFAVLTSIGWGIAGIADIVLMNITKGVMLGLMTREPYLACFYKFFPNIANVRGTGAIMMEPLFFIILDVQILITLSVLLISAMASIPTKKEN